MRFANGWPRWRELLDHTVLTVAINNVFDTGGKPLKELLNFPHDYQPDESKDVRRSEQK